MDSLIDKIQTANAPQTEDVNICPLCMSSEIKFLFWNFDRLNHLPGKFGLVQCKKCELVRLSPRPTAKSLGFYYPDGDYYSFQEPTAAIQNISMGGIFSKIRDLIRQMVFNKLGYPTTQLNGWQKMIQPLAVKFFKKSATYGWNERFPLFVKNGTALDIGCGNGTFLSFLQHYGWNIKGVELNTKAAEAARKHLKAEIFNGELKDAPFEENSFDFIVMSHVVEHIGDPLEFLHTVLKLLKRGGTVYVEVPNYNSFSQKYSRQYWYAWETPRHLLMFSPKTLRELFEKAGFTVSKTKTRLENLLAWDNTYRHEEKTSQKKAVRPFVTLADTPKLKILSASARISNLVNPDSGDFVSLWATKK
jgi:2-polyprenyl-3-methyl-5-hydroxy-6-metoxy-1,4-benzoquinol methylase